MNKTLGDIQATAEIIEITLNTLGVRAQIVEVNREADYNEYIMEVPVGTDLAKLEKKDRDLAIAVASPTGKVEWEIPIPGRSLIGLKVPNPSKEDLAKMEAERLAEEKAKKITFWWILANVRGFLAAPFYLVSWVFVYIAHEIHGRK